MSTHPGSPDAATGSGPFGTMDSAGLKRLLAGSAEFALLDVRETGTFSSGHIFRSVSLPLSHLETRAGILVPNRRTPVVLIDAGDGGLALRAAGRLADWGYTNIALLDGGLRKWQQEGNPLYSGIYVPNKAFGEFVEHRCATPHIDAPTLMRWQKEGKDMVILDSRPYEEFVQFSLPGGINCPGAELVHRAFSLARRPETTIVVNCAGRTRSIIGAQSLINAGIPNPVVSLKDGTAGWFLHGGKLRENATEVAAPPTPEGLQRALAASQEVARRFGVAEIDATQLARLKDDAGRSLFLLDVRTPEEYFAGHRPDSRSAPGGQLIQSTEQYVGVHGARIVLVDDNGVRARMTASWLLQLGWREVYVLRDGLKDAGALQRGPEPATAMGQPVEPDFISVAEARALWEQDQATFLDLSDSLTYRRGHIPRAWFVVRSRLAPGMEALRGEGPVVAVSKGGRFAALAAADIRAATRRPVRVLKGGTRAWLAAGLDLAGGWERMGSETDDVWYSPYDFDDREASMKAYLSWEVGLVAQLEREAGVLFSMPPAQSRQPAPLKASDRSPE